MVKLLNVSTLWPKVELHSFRLDIQMHLCDHGDRFICQVIVNVYVWSQRAHTRQLYPPLNAELHTLI